jgi:hypothetical protein
MLASDQECWVTYAEAGKLLGISTQAARMLAKRRGWARRTPNAYGDRAMILVPSDAIDQARTGSLGVRTGYATDSDQTEPNQLDQENVRALENAIDVLREQLGTAHQQVKEERSRADRAEQRADEERARADRAEEQITGLRCELAEARTAEQLKTTEADNLRRRLDAEADERREVQAQLTSLLTTSRRRWWRWRRRGKTAP